MQQCMKIYDYKDESKDVKGKVSRPRKSSNFHSSYRLSASTLSPMSNKCSKTRKQW